MHYSVNNEKDFIRFMDEIDDRLHALSKRSSIANYRRLLGKDHEDLEALNAKVSEILLDAERRDIIREWKEKVTESRLKRRAEIFALNFLQAQVDNDPELFAMANKLESVIVEFRPEIDGKKLSRSELRRIIQTEKDRELRRKAVMAGKRLGVAIRDDVLKLFDKRNQIARELGYPGYVGLGLFLQDLDENELKKLFYEVKRLTDDIWAATLEDIRSALGIDEVKSWDLSYYIHSVLPAPPDARFPKSGILPAFRKTLAEMGGDLDALPIQVVIQDIPYGGLCMCIDFGKDIRILANPVDGIIGYDTLFHEFGHGIHSSLLDTSSYLVASGDPAFFWEGIAGIFERIVHEPDFLRNTFQLNAREIDDSRRRMLLERILWFRNIAVLCLLEWSIYRGDPSPEKTLQKLTEEFIGISSEPEGWAGNTLFTTHPLYNQNYLLMEVMALQTIEAVREKFGGFPAPGVFDFIVENYVAPAGWKPWREKILAVTEKSLTGEALGKYLSAAS